MRHRLHRRAREAPLLRASEPPRESRACENNGFLANGSNVLHGSRASRRESASSDASVRSISFVDKCVRSASIAVSRASSLASPALPKPSAAAARTFASSSDKAAANAIALRSSGTPLKTSTASFRPSASSTSNAEIAASIESRPKTTSASTTEFRSPIFSLFARDFARSATTASRRGIAWAIDAASLRTRQSESPNAKIRSAGPSASSIFASLLSGKPTRLRILIGERRANARGRHPCPPRACSRHDPACSGRDASGAHHRLGQNGEARRVENEHHEVVVHRYPGNSAGILTAPQDRRAAADRIARRTRRSPCRRRARRAFRRDRSKSISFCASLRVAEVEIEREDR